MAHQVRYQNSRLLLLLLLLLASCANRGKQAAACKVISDTTAGLKAVNGTLYLHDTLFNGTVVSLFPGTADTAAIMNFKNGAEDGIWKKFYPNAMPEETRQYEAGKKTGEYLAWWPNGHKKLQYRFKEGEYEGACYEWNENGQLVKEANYKAGHEDGLQQIFYDNGKIHSNFMVIKGRRYGLLGTKNCVNVSDSIFN